jgi:hypothetical protein
VTDPAGRRLVVVSGGQTGVDRGALDAAVEAGTPYGGWCPAGGLAEDLPEAPGLLARYPRLREAPSSDPGVRTRLNVRDSDATLVVAPDGPLTGGTGLTVTEAVRTGRPHLVTTGRAEQAAAVLDWLREVAAALDHGGPLVLNVAGPRASGWTDGHEATRALLAAVLERW